MMTLFTSEQKPQRDTADGGTSALLFAAAAIVWLIIAFDETGHRHRGLRVAHLITAALFTVSAVMHYLRWRKDRKAQETTSA